MALYSVRLQRRVLCGLANKFDDSDDDDDDDDDYYYYYYYDSIYIFIVLLGTIITSEEAAVLVGRGHRFNLLCVREISLRVCVPLFLTIWYTHELNPQHASK